MAEPIRYPLPISRGGTGAAERSQAFSNLAPQDPEVGDTITWDGEEWVISDSLTGVIEDLITVQDELADEISEMQSILRDTLSELKKIKYGITILVNKPLMELP